MQDESLLICDTELFVYVGHKKTLPASDSNGLLYSSQTESLYASESDSGRVLIWNESDITKLTLLNDTVYDRLYREGKTMVWAGISLCG